MLAIKPVG